MCYTMLFLGPLINSILSTTLEFAKDMNNNSNMSNTLDSVNSNSVSNNKEVAKNEIWNSIIYTMGYLKNQEDQNEFLTYILNNTHEDFKKKIFKVGKASKILNVNVETIRRKIRSKIIIPVEDNSANRTIYMITGESIIKCCENNEQKYSVVHYYTNKYPKEITLIIMRMLINNNLKLDGICQTLFVSLVNVSYLLGISVDELPQEKVELMNQSFVDYYKTHIRDLQNIITSRNNSIKESDDLKEDSNSYKKLEQYKQLKLSKLDTDISKIDSMIEIIDLDLSDVTDKSEKKDLLKKKLLLLNNKQDIIKEKEKIIEDSYIK